jgi:hypothetical protein
VELDRKVLPVVLAVQDHKARRVLPAFKVLQVGRVHREQLELPVHKAYRALLARLAVRDLKALSVRKVSKVFRVQLVHRE